MRQRKQIETVEQVLLLSIFKSKKNSKKYKRITANYGKISSMMKIRSEKLKQKNLSVSK